MIRSFIWLIFFVCVTVSCLDEPECFGLNNNIAGITFKNLADGTAATVYFVSVTGEGAQVVLLANAKSGKLSLPLNFYGDSTSFSLQTLDSSYQLVLKYTAQAQYVSKECGERFVLGNLEVLRHSFDSVRLVNRTPGRDINANNIEIFL